jgi:hypothetical protein
VVIGAVAGVLGLAGHSAAADYGYVRGHNCPRCGTLRLEIYRRGPGRHHTHRCGQTTWHH